MLEERAVKLLEDVLRIYSPSREEATLAGFLADRMKRDLGFRNVSVDGVNNVIGEVGSGRPSILLCGHMDTVPGQQPVNVENGLVYGRGASDAKSALVAMILAASRLANSGNIGSVSVAAVVDEEGNGVGVRELLRRGVEADFAIFGEPSGVDNVTIGYKGRLALKISCETPSVHSSAPWMSQNAVEKLFEVWTAIKTYASNMAGKGGRYGSVTACLTKIQGGSAHNVMPGRCEMTADVRVPPQMTCTQVLNDVRAIIGRFQGDLSFPKISMDVEDFTEPFETGMNSPLIRAIIRAVLKVRGKRPMLIRKTGTGDMNVLGNALRIPVVTYGPGNSHLSHTSKECVEVEDYLLSIQVLQQTILNLNTLWKASDAVS